MTRGALIALLLLAAPSGLAAKRERPDATWRSIAERDDLHRLSSWRDAFIGALEQARQSPSAAGIASEGPLLEPDAALDDADLRPGDYRCRLFRLGSADGTGGNFVVLPAVPCRVGPVGKSQAFEHLGGAQRPSGRFYPAGARQKVFIGTLMLGDETRPLGYGRDPGRDMIGALERVGVRRWRLVLPYPRFDSLLDVVELVPAS